MKNINKLLAMILVVVLVIVFVSEYGTSDITASEVSEENLGPMIEVTPLTEVPEGYTGIYTKADLNKVRNNLAGNYILMNDIVFTKADFAKGGNFYNSGNGWDPIGIYLDTPFSGTFDGNGYSIKNLCITKAGVFIGLFGHATGTIKNLGIVDCDITSLYLYNTRSFVGGIVGFLSGGTVSNCYTSGSFTTSKSTDVGGIVGSTNYYDNVTSGTIVNCYNLSNVSAVTGYGNNVGGIVGDSRGTAISNCYNLGNVSAGDAGLAGGIAGAGSAAISNCYNAGDVIVSGEDIDAGGIVGYFSSTKENKTDTITNCYNTGFVSADNKFSDHDHTFAGGIVGRLAVLREKDFTRVRNCYNIGDISATSKATSSLYLYAGGIVGTRQEGDSEVGNCYYLISTVQGRLVNRLGTSYDDGKMRQQNSFVGFDFDTVWTMAGNPDYPYPELKALGDHREKKTTSEEQNPTTDSSSNTNNKTTNTSSSSNNKTPGTSSGSNNQTTDSSSTPNSKTAGSSSGSNNKTSGTSFYPNKETTDSSSNSNGSGSDIISDTQSVIPDVQSSSSDTQTSANDTPANTQVPESDSTTVTSSNTQQLLETENNGGAWLIVVIVAGLVIGGIAVLFIFKKPKN